MVASTNALKKIIYKGYDDIAFVTRKGTNGEIKISQDILNLSINRNMNDFTPQEKGAVMGLQTLIGLQRYKQELEDKNTPKLQCESKKTQVYEQVFSTVTHDINIKTFLALQELGYIEIASITDKKKSLLIMEKLGFGQYDEAKKAVIAILKKDTQTQQEKARMMKEIKFRVTDKPLDLEELYQQYLQVKGTRGKDPTRKSIKRIGIILEGLRDRNIDIKTDALGMITIDYRAQNSFARRKQMENGYAEKKAAFHKEMQEGVDVEKETGKALTREEQRDRSVQTGRPTDEIEVRDQ